MKSTISFRRCFCVRVNCENLLIYIRFALFQDDEDSISELMVDKDKKSRFKLEKVGQVINIKSFSNTGT